MLYVISPLLIIGVSLFIFWRGIVLENWGNAAFAAFNIITATWAILEFIGIKNTVVDICLGIKNWLYVPVKKKHTDRETEHIESLDWQAILYHGDSEVRMSNHISNHTPNQIAVITPQIAEKEVIHS